MQKNEILNAKDEDYPLFSATILGDRVLCAKFSKKVSCAIKHLHLRVRFDFIYDTQKAIEIGVKKDPTLMIDGKIFIEGLLSAEEITKRFEKLI